MHKNFPALPTQEPNRVPSGIIGKEDISIEAILFKLFSEIELSFYALCSVFIEFVEHFGLKIGRASCRERV